MSFPNLGGHGAIWLCGLLKDVPRTLELQQMNDLIVQVPSSADFLRNTLCDSIKAEALSRWNGLDRQYVGTLNLSYIYLPATVAR